MLINALVDLLKRKSVLYELPYVQHPEVYGNSYHRCGHIFRAVSSTSDAA